MGNVPISCCRFKSTCSRSGSCHGQKQVNHRYKSNKSSDSGRKNRKINNGYKNSQDRSTNLSSSIKPEQSHNLQHISEREPDDSETDPSSNPFNKPIFAERGSSLCKSSSCSTIYTDGSTISQPDLEQTIKCVSLAVYSHIKNRASENYAEIFDETIHPFKMPLSEDIVGKESDSIGNEKDNDKTSEGDPIHMTIYLFLKTLFKAAQLSSEYAITTLVYLERLVTYGELDITTKTWRRMLLGAILLSSKVWEDQAVWNVDYAQILEEISVDDINQLESSFLELIQFNMNVPSSVYAKYYFHLRTLAVKNGLSKDRSLLNISKARALEAMSTPPDINWKSSPIHRKSSTDFQRYTSLERLRLNGRTRAVLM